MYGAILGDVVGSVYEWRPTKTKDFPLFTSDSRFTDDTVMSMAVAEVCLSLKDNGVNKTSDEDILAMFAASMRKWGAHYPHAGYGGNFSRWLIDKSMGAYNSYGNGSAMRVSAAGWLFTTLEETRRIARLSAAVTHNHLEGIKGAESVASIIYLLRNGSSKKEIKTFASKEFGYGLEHTVSSIRPAYQFDMSCQGSVPEAIISFLEADSTLDAVRNAVSLGGDADTLGCIAGSMAEAMYGLNDALKDSVKKHLDNSIIEVADNVEKASPPTTPNDAE